MISSSDISILTHRFSLALHKLRLIPGSYDLLEEYDYFEDFYYNLEQYWEHKQLMFDTLYGDCDGSGL